MNIEQGKVNVPAGRVISIDAAPLLLFPLLPLIAISSNLKEKVASWHPTVQ